MASATPIQQKFKKDRYVYVAAIGPIIFNSIGTVEVVTGWIRSKHRVQSVQYYRKNNSCLVCMYMCISLHMWWLLDKCVCKESANGYIGILLIYGKRASGSFKQSTAKKTKKLTKTIKFRVLTRKKRRINVPVTCVNSAMVFVVLPFTPLLPIRKLLVLVEQYTRTDTQTLTHRQSCVGFKIIHL